MTRDEIIEMGKKAGVFTEAGYCTTVGIEVAERFAALVAAAERAACAKVCEDYEWVSGHRLPSNVAMAAAIRARGTHPAPAQRKPLTDEQLAELMMKTWGCSSIAPRHAPEFARAIEAAHGIKEQA